MEAFNSRVCNGCGRVNNKNEKRREMKENYKKYWQTISKQQ